MKKALKKPFVAIAFLVIACIATVLQFTTKDYKLNGLTEVEPDWIVDYQVSSNGFEAYLESEHTIFCLDETGEVAYRIDSLDDSDQSIYTDICFDERDHLYVHKLVFDSSAYVTTCEAIEEYDEKGEFVKYIALFDYSEEARKPHRESRIMGLNCIDGHVRYMYLNYDGTFTLNDCDLDTLVTESSIAFELDGAATVCRAASFSDGDYAVILTNGNVGRINADGEFILYAECDYQISELDTAYLPVDMCVLQDDIYVISGTMADDLYKVTQESVEKICSVKDAFGENSWDMTFDLVSTKDNQLALFCNGKMVVLGDTYQVVDQGDTSFRMDAGFVLQTVANRFGKYVAILTGIIGIILLIGYFAKWKSTLLLKQLCMTIPLVIILVVALLVTMTVAVRQSYEDTLTNEMVAINELIIREIDCEEIASIKDMSAVDNGVIKKYCDYLSDAVDHNSGYWNKNFDIGIYLIDDELQTYTLVAGNYDFSMPFKEINYNFEEGSDADELDESLEGTNSQVLYIDDGYNVTNMIVDTPIIDSNGKAVAVLELSADISTVNDSIKVMTKKVGMFVIIFLPIFCLALAIISYFNIRYLNKLSDVVNDISEGDFKARVDKIPRDEVGQICNNVNQMAKQLDDYFSIMDRNEKFYYKFVPEKFKELLHKEEFTDLALGDAESADLTVLFCDIRAFSLNSEMMTAKENFEFVNVVYGKAGPIIRRHNGFIDKYIGDAIMALFENADDAIAAGREMYREIVLNPETAKELNVSSINIGIGIHSGMARIGIVGENERMSGTVISNTVNLSSRLESLTKRYAAAMLISKDTLDRLTDPDSLNTRYLGMIQVAGVNEVKAIYEVLDCLGKEDEEFKTSQKNDFKEAIRLFHLGHQKDALDIMLKLKAIKDKENGNDPALDLYAEYIEEGIKAGNTDTKIFRFSKK